MTWVAPSAQKRDAEVQYNMKTENKSVLQVEKDSLIMMPKSQASANVSNELGDV